MKSQKGGFGLGMVVGLLLGLALALGVALYVTKVPVPLMNKVSAHSPEQDAVEAQHNRNWDPNAPLAGKAGAVRAALPASAPPLSGSSDATQADAPPAAAQATPPDTSPPARPASGMARSNRDPSQILSGQGDAGVKTSADTNASDDFVYFVQAGAYSKQEDAEQQHARLAILGYTAKISEREQNGRTVYRVRLGPFDRKDEAEAQQVKIKSVEPESSLVRVERSR